MSGGQKRIALSLIVMCTHCNAESSSGKSVSCPEDVSGLLQTNVKVADLESAEMFINTSHSSKMLADRAESDIGKSGQLGPVATVIYTQWLPFFLASNATAVVECCYTDSSVMTFYNVKDGCEEIFKGKDRIKAGLQLIMGQLFKPSKPKDWDQRAFTVTEAEGNHHGHVFSLFKAPSVGFGFSSSTASMDANAKIAQEICIFQYTSSNAHRYWRVYQSHDIRWALSGVKFNGAFPSGGTGDSSSGHAFWEYTERQRQQMHGWDSNAKGPSWVSYDFGCKAVDVQSVDLCQWWHNACEYCITTFSVQYSDDGSTWTTKYQAAIEKNVDYTWKHASLAKMA